MDISSTRPANTLAFLERRAEASFERLRGSMENMDYSSQADWQEVWNNQVDSKMSTWARNELHRMQHQTTKSILAMT
jgi:hypothetical protein